MPDSFVARSQYLVSSQLQLQPGLPNVVFNPPASQAQPIGSTPLWCKATPNGSNDSIFFETSTGNAVYFPSFAIARDDAGKPKVKFTQPHKPQVDTVLAITLVPQPASAAQVSQAAGAALKVCPEAYYADHDGHDTTTVQLLYNNGTMRIAFDITPDPTTGALACSATMKDYAVIGEVIGTLVNNGSVPGNRASIVVTRVVAAVGVAAGTVPSPPPVPTHPPLQHPIDRPVATRVTDRGVIRPQMIQAIKPASETFIDPRRVRWSIPVDPAAASTVHIPEVPPGKPTPVYIQLTNQSVTATLPNVWFLDTLSADIVGDVQGVKATQAGYRPVPVPGYSHPLFQDLNDETSFFFVPEAFKIARRETAPYLPLLNVTISGTTLEDAHATLFFTALPVVDTVKLEAARTVVQQAHSGETITLQPLPTPTGVQFGMFLPGTNPFVVRAVPVALDRPLIDSPQLSLDDFQTAFASLTAPISQYLQGKISIPLGGAVIEVPLVARADDFPGLLFQQTRTVSADNTTLSLVLANGVEGAVQVDALPVTAARAGTAVPCTVTCDPPLPASIAAADAAHPGGGTLTVTVTPASGPADSLELSVSQDHCHVVPDASALLRAILDPNVPIKATHEIAAVVPSVLFGGDTADPDKKILVITMSFLNGNTIRFVRPTDASMALQTPDKPGEVNLSVSDYLLRQSGGDTVKYKLAITYANGHTISDADWRVAPNDSFVLDLP